MSDYAKTFAPLALAGTLPFVACALLPLAGVVSVPYLGALDRVVAAYGLAIVCFLAGALWGSCLNQRSVASPAIFIGSNAIFLAVWFTYLGASVDVAILTQLVALLVLLLVDHELRKKDVISHAYFRLRAKATIVAVVSLLLVLAR